MQIYFVVSFLGFKFALTALLFQLDGHIALSIRGNCAFTEKAKHAEAAGASALLVINDKEGFAFR